MPGSGITISKTAVRGVDSFGMLCSAHDIGWSDKADGALIVMPDETQPGDACPAEPPKVITTSLGTDASACMHLTDKNSIVLVHLHLHALKVCDTQCLHKRDPTEYAASYAGLMLCRVLIGCVDG